jgi:hypothetical protein
LEEADVVDAHSRSLDAPIPESVPDSNAVPLAAHESADDDRQGKRKVFSVIEKIAVALTLSSPKLSERNDKTVTSLSEPDTKKLKVVPFFLHALLVFSRGTYRVRMLASLVLEIRRDLRRKLDVWDMSGLVVQVCYVHSMSA